MLLTVVGAVAAAGGGCPIRPARPCALPPRSDPAPAPAPDPAPAPVPRDCPLLAPGSEPELLPVPATVGCVLFSGMMVILALTEFGNHGKQKVRACVRPAARQAGDCGKSLFYVVGRYR